MTKITIKIEAIECNVCNRNDYTHGLKTINLSDSLEGKDVDICPECDREWYIKYEDNLEEINSWWDNEYIDLGGFYFAIKRDN